ncbi:hypothetical protein FVQ98_10105 [Ottowia sp. GY511]|uniref:Uncharacterized protein n=1 Tax=Ottowia flava TaxID=2675430 RepID=A0ABW4KQA1_9BURK|nr:hypothetical protein [Ottowia sp. GY511]TXK28323.1 hypothetical protein FVQ98_10105 [Ottowia sp. GY511]
MNFMAKGDSMARWANWCAAALVAGAMAGCGGDGDRDGGAAVTPLSEMRPGEKFATETPLLAGGSQVSHYVVYGVTPQGALVDSDQPDLLAGERVPILEFVERDGRRSDTLAAPQEQAKILDPTKLQRIQVEFYQQLWDAVAEREGTRDPQAILAEIDDLDGRVVDLMDDVDASGVTLPQYLAFYDLLDEMPAFANNASAVGAHGPTGLGHQGCGGCHQGEHGTHRRLESGPGAERLGRPALAHLLCMAFEHRLHGGRREPFWGDDGHQGQGDDRQPGLDSAIGVSPHAGPAPTTHSGLDSEPQYRPGPPRRQNRHHHAQRLSAWPTPVS